MKGAIFSALLAVTISVFLPGCDSSTDVVWQGDSSNGRVVATLHGVITRQDTRQPIAGVRIIYAVQGAHRETESDENGLYRIDDLRESSYTLIFLSPDDSFADREEVVTIDYEPPADFPSDRDYEIMLSRDVTMYTRNANARGHVYARLDNESTMPAAGVQVRASGFTWVLNGEFTTTTDENGFYSFENLPATAATFTALPWTYEDVLIGAAAAQANLIAGGTITVPNITAAPANAAVVVISNNFANGDFAVDGTLELDFNTPIIEETLDITLIRSATALMTVSELSEDGRSLSIDPAVMLRPSTNYSLTISGRAQNYAAFTIGPMAFSTAEGIELIASSLWQDDGFPREDVGLDEAITFDFSHEIEISHPDNIVWVRRGTSDVLVEFVYSEDHRRVTVTPVGSYVGNTDYTFGYEMHSMLPQDYASGQQSFHTLASIVVPGTVTGFEATDPNNIDWNSTLISVRWNAAVNAESYEIYAYDSFGVTHHVRVGSFQAHTLFGVESNTFSLPNEFDWMTADVIQTPFTNGIQVMLQVRALNGSTHGEFSPVLTLSDNVPPVVTVITQSGTANNSGFTQPRTVTCTFNADIEYCSTTPPTWEFVENGGNSGYVLPHDAAEWVWDNDLRNGRLIITVPPQAHGGGDLLRVTGITDASGNVQTQPVTRILN